MQLRPSRSQEERILQVPDNRAAIACLLIQTCNDLSLWLEHQQSLGATLCPYVPVATQSPTIPVQSTAAKTIQRPPNVSAAPKSPQNNAASTAKQRTPVGLSGFRKLKQDTVTNKDNRSVQARAKDLQALAAECSACRRCALFEKRASTIFGKGPLDCDLLCLGLGLEPEEAQTSSVFAGQSGELMDNMLKAMGLSRSEVYLTNVLKCACTRREKITQSYINCCQYFLVQEISLVNPRVIIAWGEAAFRAIIRDNAQSIVQVRGKWFDYQGIAVMPTFHPAYLLRKPELKRQVWADLQEVMRKLKLAPA